jgi:hypothetical protein
MYTGTWDNIEYAMWMSISYQMWRQFNKNLRLLLFLFKTTFSLYVGLQRLCAWLKIANIIPANEGQIPYYLYLTWLLHRFRVTNERYMEQTEKKHGVIWFRGLRKSKVLSEYDFPFGKNLTPAFIECSNLLEPSRTKNELLFKLVKIFTQQNSFISLPYANVISPGYMFQR